MNLEQIPVVQSLLAIQLAELENGSTAERKRMIPLYLADNCSAELIDCQLTNTTRQVVTTIVDCSRLNLQLTSILLADSLTHSVHSTSVLWLIMVVRGVAHVLSQAGDVAIPGAGMSAISSPNTSVSASPTPDPNTRGCENGDLMDSFGIFLQGLLGVVAFSTLMCEQPAKTTLQYASSLIKYPLLLSCSLLDVFF